MVFSSEIFLFIFFPTVFILYRLLPRHSWKNALLAVTSLVFYAWGQPLYILLLLFSVLCNYLAGLGLMNRDSKRRKLYVTLAIVVNLGILSIYKYMDFFISSFNGLFSLSLPLSGLVLPIGISFFTFQGLSYVIDVYREPELGSRHFSKILLYISFFPQLIAGPIVNYHDVAAQIDERRTSPALTSDGLRRFIIGLAKKLLIANTLGQVADSVFSLTGGELDMRLAWLGAVCYTLQIYFDFSGYSDMAIGLGRVFGFRFKENFDHPYCSSSITEFWRRWHISLSTWFRNYLYIPLGGNKKGRARTIINKFAVFLLSGLWHGANWTFVVWGAFHGTLTIAEFLINGGKVRSGKFTFRHIPGLLYTLLAVTIGFVIFRADNLSSAWFMITAMFGGLAKTAVSTGIWRSLTSPLMLATLLTGIIASSNITGLVRNKLLTARASTKARVNFLSYIYVSALYLLCILNLSASSFNPFIYFQF